MSSFLSDGIEIAYDVSGDGRPVLLIHGFASSGAINWLNTGWVAALNAAGYKTIAMDNRGHGRSRKLYDPRLYLAHQMADDAASLLGHLGLDRVPVIGFSMGARIAAFLMLRHPARIPCAVWGGMGANLMSGMDDSEAIAAALTAETLDEVEGEVGRRFRIFADHSKADRAALAACVVASREPMPADEVRRITAPVLVAVGENDEMAGGLAPLVDLLPAGEGFVIPKRNHMLSTGDPRFKAAAIRFLDMHRT